MKYKHFLEDQTVETHINNKQTKSSFCNHNLATSPNKWSMDQVEQFISTFADDETSERFKRGRINGESLLYLTKEILLDDLKLSIGSAIVILQTIGKLRERVKKIWLWFIFKFFLHSIVLFLFIFSLCFL
jgi:hypothetical protein